MAALDQLNGRLAFANAAVAKDQDAFAVYFHQHAVTSDAGGELGAQCLDQGAHQRGGHLSRLQQWHAVLLGKLHHFRQRLKSAGQDDCRRLEREKLFEMGTADLRIQLIQVGKLSQADDLDPGAVKVLIVTGQHDAGAVYLGGIDLELVKILGGVGNGQMGFARKLVKADEKLLHGKCAPFQF